MVSRRQIGKSQQCPLRLLLSLIIKWLRNLPSAKLLNQLCDPVQFFFSWPSFSQSTLAKPTQSWALKQCPQMLGYRELAGRLLKILISGPRLWGFWFNRWGWSEKPLFPQGSQRSNAGSRGTHLRNHTGSSENPKIITVEAALQELIV